MIKLLFLIIIIFIIYLIFKSSNTKKTEIKEIKKQKNYKLKTEDKVINKKIKYTNIYELAPFQATSLSPINNSKMNFMIKQMNSYPKKIITNPNWKCSWTNNYNNMYCFIDRHLNRKCIWTC